MTLKMAFFATMGGFCNEEMTEDGPQWKSLDFDVLLRSKTMHMVNNYPYIPIKDKSKAGGVAKVIACMQTGLILLQVLGRYLDQLHITLLEINTSVHVVLQ